jgi:hypothetical protein
MHLLDDLMEAKRLLDELIYLVRCGLPFRGRLRTCFHTQLTAFFSL